LIQGCNLNGIDVYLTDFLQRIVSERSRSHELQRASTRPSAEVLAA